MTNSETLAKWRDWIERIRADVDTLYFDRCMFQNVVDIVNANKQLDTQSLFFGFFERIYGDSIVMGIRRQLKDDSDSISLARLLREVKEQPNLVTRSDFYRTYSDRSTRVTESINRVAMDHIMSETFDRFALSDSPHIDPARIERDIDKLKDACKEAELLADRYIAHWDRRRVPGFTVPFPNIYNAIDALGDMVKKYGLLFLGHELELCPSYDPSIFDIFNEPWSIPASVPHNRHRF